MATRKIQEERIRPLNEKGVRDGDYVLYWLQQAQRAEYNHALEYAVQQANELGQPLLVVFGLMEVCPRSYKRPVLPGGAAEGGGGERGGVGVGGWTKRPRACIRGFAFSYWSGGLGVLFLFPPKPPGVVSRPTPALRPPRGRLERVQEVRRRRPSSKAARISSGIAPSENLLAQTVQ